MPEIEEEEAEPELPPMYAHGDPDPRPIKAWAIKGLLQTQGHGLLERAMGHVQELHRARSSPAR